LCSDSDGDDEGETTARKSDSVNFVVMLKKNNKAQVQITINIQHGVEMSRWFFSSSSTIWLYQVIQKWH
jgi:hypothetical protein